MRLLVLGGTLFVGRAIVAAGLDRGWDVTTFNRGVSGSDIGGVEIVRGDRTAHDDVARLATLGPWDAAVDLCGYVPRQVLMGARLLEPTCAMYVFVSTVSAYAGWPVQPLSELSPILDCPAEADADYGPPDIEDGPTRYGRLKFGCEEAVRLTFGTNRTTVVRPGVVLGPGEYVGRLPWWLRRVAAGGRVIAPGEPSRSIQPLDVRDAAQFILSSVERSLSGTFNVTAPVDRDTFGGLLAACQAVTNSDAEFVWVPDAELLALGVRQWSELPLWRTHPGVWKVDSSAAFNAGLRCRPLLETVSATWDWLDGADQASANGRSAEVGLSSQREQAIWAAVS